MAHAVAADLDNTLRALADANRRAILTVIRGGAHPVGAVAGITGLSQQTTSHHLRVLRDAGLAAETREGTRRLYIARPDGLAIVRSYLDDFWPARLAALKIAVESRDGTPDG